MKLKQTIDTNTNSPVLQGTIATWTFKAKFKLNPITSSNWKAPDYEIVGFAPSGEQFQIGIAYEHRIKNGEQAGRNMFHLYLECELEEVPSGTYVAFPHEDAIDEWDITVARPRKQEQANVQEQPQNDNFDQ